MVAIAAATIAAIIPAISPETSIVGALEKNMVLNHCFCDNPHLQPVQYLLNHEFRISQINILTSLSLEKHLQQLFREETPSALDNVLETPS